MSRSPLVCDTTVLLYLGRIGRADLIPALFEPVYVPELVVLELDMGRLWRPDTFNPREWAWIRVVSVSRDAINALPPNRLGPGERSVIAYVYSHHGYVAGLDDLQARRLAEELGLAVVGTLGILLRARQARLILSVRPLLDALIAEGFRIDDDLYHEVLNLAGE